MKNVLKWLMTTMAVLGLSACGGGSGGNNGSGNSSSDVEKLSSHKRIPSKLMDVLKGNTTLGKQLGFSKLGSSSNQCNQVGVYTGNYKGNADKGKSLSMVFPGGGVIFIAYSTSLYNKGEVFYGAGFRKGSQVDGAYYDLYNNNKQGHIDATISNNVITGNWENNTPAGSDKGEHWSTKLLKAGNPIYEHTGFLLFDDDTLAAIYDIQVDDDNRMYGYLLLPNGYKVEVNGEYYEDDNSFNVESQSIDGTRVKLRGHIGSSDFGGEWESDNGLKGTILGRGCYRSTNNDTTPGNGQDDQTGDDTTPGNGQDDQPGTNGTITHHGVTYGTVTSPYTGRVWLDRNLGASRVCTALDDEQCYGDYYQWGRNADGHEKKNSPTTDVQASSVTNVGHGKFITATYSQDNDWAKNIDADGRKRIANWNKTDGSGVCPAGYRVPTIDEYKAELFDDGSAQISNPDDAFSSFLKLPAAGYRYSELDDTTIHQIGSKGNYWAATASSNGDDSRYVHTGATWLGARSDGYRDEGYSVRCIKDQTPTNTITHNGITYGTVTSPYTGRIWLDRNLGASRVCTSYDDAQCFGDYYQWGRNADGHEKKDSETTDVQASSVTNVGHGKFITTDYGDGNNYDWASNVDPDGHSRINNWAKSDGSSICPLGYRVPTIIEIKAELLDEHSENVHNNLDAYTTFLKLPSAGFRFGIDGTMTGQNTHGSLSSVSVDNGASSSYYDFYYDSNQAVTAQYGSRVSGSSVRCIKASSSIDNSTVSNSGDDSTTSTDQSVLVSEVSKNSSVDFNATNTYHIAVSAGQDVDVLLDNLSGDIDLYVRIGSQPDIDAGVYDCSSTNSGTEDEWCSVSVGEDTTVYVSVYGYEAGDYTLTAMVTDTVSE